MSGRRISPQVTVEIICGESTHKASMTGNLALVLRTVEETGSLNAAVKRLHMGYSNTLYAICAIEGALGFKLLDRVCPKGSVLTDEGRRLLELYEKTQNETQDLADKLACEAGSTS